MRINKQSEDDIDFVIRGPEIAALYKYSEALREFVLPYEAVRTASHPEEMLLTFLQSTYEAAVKTAHWDRTALECAQGRAGICRPVP